MLTGTPYASAAPQTPAAQAPLAVLHRWTEICALCVTVAQVLVIEITGRNGFLEVGPVNLQAADLAMPLVPLLAFFLIVRRIRPPVISLLVAGFYAISLTRGIILNQSPAITAFRYDVTFLLLLVIVSSGGVERMGFETVRKLFIAAALIACAVSLSRFAMGPNFMVNLGNVDIETLDDWNDGRTIGGPAVILMEVAILLNMTREMAKGGMRLKLDASTVFFFAMVVASGQRTATLGLVAALCLMAINRARQLLLLVMAAVPVAMFVFSTGALQLGIDTAEDVGQGLGGRSGTFAFRTQIWRSFLHDFSSWPGLDQLFGEPLGTPRTLYVLGRVWSASLHSGYVGLLPLIGILGTTVLLVALFIYVIRLISHFMAYKRYQSSLSPELRLYFAMVVLFYAVSYEWRNVFGLMMGALFAPMTVKAARSVREAVAPRLQPLAQPNAPAPATPRA